jgi:uncharacterized protein YigE (DUF2233 family)
MTEWLSPLIASFSSSFRPVFAGIVLLTFGLLAGASAPLAAQDSPCQPMTVDEASYIVCTVDPARQAIRLAWRNADGEPYGGLSAFSASVAAAGETLVFAMNGGMYHPDLRPVGLYIEKGREWAKLSTSCGRQNFNLCPNGVFYLSGGKAAVMETRRYRRERPTPDFATQSGPMLVIDGKLHPKFRADSDSRKIRNGVGVRVDGTVVFAISNDYVTFHQFGVLFRDTLDTPNALFLDGTISSLHAPSVNRADSFWPVGPIIGVTEPKTTGN